ncbi:MAG: ABC transporter permease [Firmicutes bacterium HGW-Firmicutes-12]|jgi:ABC-type nitrate/sulfonate/bicarbonate transport system permease component|nr:MAG: ABC transporter permease [Firmicutes bacterium HGW-Firmicutes-12]
MRKFMPSLIFFSFLLLLWEYIVKAFQIDKFILPPPSAIFEALINSSLLLLEHSKYTALEAFIGFSLAVFAGMVLAMIISLITAVKKTLYPLVIVSQTVPIMAVAPLLIIWFGYGLLPKVMVVALVCFFPITVSLVEGLEKVDADVIRLLQAMGANKFQVFIKVQLPAALPSLFSGLKISATYSIMAAVIAEWLGASRGLGIYLTRSMHSFQTEQVFAVIIVISGLSLAFVALVEGAGRMLMPWYYKKHSVADQK